MLRSFCILGLMTVASLNAQYWATDASFAPVVNGSNAAMYAIGMQPDGKLLIDASIPASAGLGFSGHRLVRLNRDGSLDAAFGAPVSPTYGVYGIAVQPTGKIIEWGPFSATDGARRYNADGTPDASFHAPTGGVCFALDGAGAMYSSGFDLNGNLHRYSVDGVLDPTFTAAPMHSITGIYPQPDGSVIVMQDAQPSQSFASGPRTLVRLKHDGGLDPTYNVSLNSFAGNYYDAVAMPDGTLLVSSEPSLIVNVHHLNGRGEIDYHYSYDAGNGAPALNAFKGLAGAAYDLLHAANAPTSALVQGRFYTVQQWLSVSAAGEMRAMNTSGTSLSGYQRTNIAGPTVDPAPKILQDAYGSKSVDPGQSLSVFAIVTGLDPMTLRWTRDGVPLIGYDSASLVIDNPQPGDSGTYTLTITNQYGSVATTPTKIAVSAIQAPKIVSAPRNVTVPPGGSATLSVVATGTPPLRYSWSRNFGGDIAGATNSSLTLTNVTATSADNYTVIVHDDIADRYWDRADITVTVASVDFTGTFIGTAGSGNVAVITHPDGTADLLLINAPAARMIVASGFNVAADGTFSGNATSYTTGQGPGSGTAVTLNGKFSAGGTVTGGVAGESLTFTAARTSQAMAGFYRANTVEAEGTAYAINDGHGRVVAAANIQGVIFGGAGSSVANTLTLSAGNATVTLTMDAAAGRMGIASGNSGPALSGSGIRDDVTGTQRLANISSRGLVGRGEDALIAGFVIGGPANIRRQVLIRAVGPTLEGFSVQNALRAPHLTLYRDSTVVYAADKWGAFPRPGDISDTASRVGAFPLAVDSADAAFIATLPPGSYTASVTSGDGQPGVALAEVYDAGTADDGVHLSNISSRGRVGAADNAMIVGVVVTGNQPKRILIRGVGPTLVAYGVGDSLSDPVLTLKQGQRTIVINDDWTVQSGGVTSQEIIQAAKAVGAFDLTAGSKDAAILITLNPGSYTAVLSGSGTSTGVALAEVYEVP